MSSDREAGQRFISRKTILLSVGSLQVKAIQDSWIGWIQVLQQLMSQNIGSEQDEFLQQFFGKTNTTDFNYQDQQLQPLSLEPIDMLPMFEASQEQISNPLFQSSPEQSQIFPHAEEVPYRLEDTLRGEAERGSPSSEENRRAAKREKNSNAIKKIGRIILDNLREYRQCAGNGAVSGMLKLLSKDSKVGRTEVNKRDKFNTYHLRALFGGKDPQLVARNLKTTRAILSRHLRPNVLGSRQISDRNKALYLNTMKCTVLRCSNKALAVRLQMAADQ